mgnify:CR=1 FL=1
MERLEHGATLADLMSEFHMKDSRTLEKQLRQARQEQARPARAPRARLFTDGAARGNPWPAGAGAVIVTGTPQGVGFARKPPSFLKDGDRVVVEVEGIGRLQNHVNAER